MEKQILALKKEKQNINIIIIYCRMKKSKMINIVISFSLKNSPFIGPLAIVHEPEAN